jgi:site-specific recombinase XerD
MPTTDLAALIRGFFDQHLVAQRGLSGHTVLSYRDTFKLLLEFACREGGKSVTELVLADLTPELVHRFLRHLEEDRHNGIVTRNLRLAAIHAFFRFLATVDPRHLTHSHAILAVPFKRRPHRVAQYLERDEVQEVFRQIDCRTLFGQRDDALLRMLYNTGMRAQELVDLDVRHVRFSRPFTVLIFGKGRKERVCPLWHETVASVKSYLQTRSVRFTDAVPLFLNTDGNRLTRYGVRYIVAHRISQAAQRCPTLLSRSITPHTWRHTTAMHLLQSNVDLAMIRSWLGHASIETTNTYVEIDLEMKRKTLASAEKVLPKPKLPPSSWRANKDVLSWLSSL